MLVKNVTRGNSVTFTSSFLDANNNLTVPASPTLSLYYKSNNIYITTTFGMSESNDTVWTASWDSSNADVGVVEWHISGGNATPIAMDGEFKIYANRANGGPGASS